jgi:hypothetical protein
LRSQRANFSFARLMSFAQPTRKYHLRVTPHPTQNPRITKKIGNSRLRIRRDAQIAFDPPKNWGSPGK